MVKQEKELLVDSDFLNYLCFLSESIVQEFVTFSSEQLGISKSGEGRDGE